jgi:hypothetical protein
MTGSAKQSGVLDCFVALLNDGKRHAVVIWTNMALARKEPS